jgi:UDP-N-acetylglucosamine/UDP-N-acetylgalactosamine diphosphorylase
MDQMLVQRLQQYNHNNVVELLRVLCAEEHQRLLEDLRRIDFDQVAALSAGCQGCAPGVSGEEVFQPADVLRFDGLSSAGAERRRLCRVGEDALAEGRVAVFLVAGGQGTRLGFSGPKGCYPVSPLRGKSLFQLFAESILARSRRSGRALD